MPLGFERLNERSQRPNANINFIKPLTSSSARDQEIATDFLERIAAQCYPIMKKNYISVMALEEYPPNPEFLGRNFNAGEVVQLVLKDKAGRWLSFKFVQMVMMHELAHCKQMNHSKFFWQFRNQYAGEMKGLWGRKYEGEGLWGRGRDLTSGAFVHDRVPEENDVPEHLCGGTYRRGRGRKRKRGQDDGKPKLSYAERQQKRITKKFGVHGEGQGLGEDDLVRGALEQGKRQQGKPRVAGSKRGRELRANAALARFEAAKHEKEKTPDPDGSETESDDEWDNRLPVLERLGATTIKDSNGKDMFQVCGDEGEDEQGAKDEFEELRQISKRKPVTRGSQRPQKTSQEDSETESEPDISAPQYRSGRNPQETHEDWENESKADEAARVSSAKTATKAIAANKKSAAGPSPPVCRNDSVAVQAPPAPSPASNPPLSASSDSHSASMTACEVCSLENDPDSPTCMACANVLKPKLVPNSWRCKNDACKGSNYLNAGDAGRCGLCGSQRPAGRAMAGVSASRPVGVTGSEVLKWD